MLFFRPSITNWREGKGGRKPRYSSRAWLRIPVLSAHLASLRHSHVIALSHRCLSEATFSPHRYLATAFPSRSRRGDAIGLHAHSRELSRDDRTTSALLTSSAGY